MDTAGKEIDAEKLGDYSKALKDYKKTGSKQCLAILKDLLESDVSMNQLKESKIGAALSKIAKEESNDPDEKTIKEMAVQLFKKCKQRDDNKPASSSMSDSQKSIEKKPTNGSTTETKKPEKEEKESASPEKKSRSEKSNNEEKKPRNEEQKNTNMEVEASIAKKKINEEPKREPYRETQDERKREAGRDSGRDAGRDSGRDSGRDAGRDSGRDAGRDAGRDSGKRSATKDNTQGLDKLPLLSPDYRNFTLRTISDGLLADYKTNPSEKEKLRPISNKRALDIEKALWEIVKGNDETYRMEARNISTFLAMKSNHECRKILMDGGANYNDFVLDRKKFMSKSAQEKLEESSRRIIDANNADYDKKIVRESSLYQCKKCKSKRISKTEKQTRSGDEPMTSFFTCVDCGAGWKE